MDSLFQLQVEQAEAQNKSYFDYIDEDKYNI